MSYISYLTKTPISSSHSSSLRSSSTFSCAPAAVSSTPLAAFLPQLISFTNSLILTLIFSVYFDSPRPYYFSIFRLFVKQTSQKNKPSLPTFNSLISNH